MPGTLVFPIDDTLKRIVEHTRKHGKCRVAYSKEYTEKPSLFFVKDDGAYLMSASDVPLRKDPDDKDSGNVVAYAEGLNPKTDGDIWEAQQFICGGDDFAENIDLKIVEDGILHGYKKLKIKLTETSMEVRITKR